MNAPAGVEFWYRPPCHEGHPIRIPAEYVAGVERARGSGDPGALVNVECATHGCGEMYHLHPAWVRRRCQLAPALPEADPTGGNSGPGGPLDIGP